MKFLPKNLSLVKVNKAYLSLIKTPSPPGGYFPWPKSKNLIHPPFFILANFNLSREKKGFFFMFLTPNQPAHWLSENLSFLKTENLKLGPSFLGLARHCKSPLIR
jgi:hypothetical protein